MPLVPGPVNGHPRPPPVGALRARRQSLGTVPPATGTSLPSGTATACMAGATWIALRFGPRWGALAVGLAVLVSLTRLYAGVHYPTDLAAGWLLGAATAIGVDRLSRLADRKAVG